jgi:hypothetical protein
MQPTRKVCPHCGTNSWKSVSPEPAAVNPEPAQPVAPSVAVQPEQLHEKLVYCGECGAPMQPTWKVCPHCGTNSWKSVSPEPPAINPEPAQFPKLLGYAILGISVVSLPAVVFLAIAQPPANPLIIALPLGMFAVGFDIVDPSKPLKRVCWAASLTLLVISGLSTAALVYWNGGGDLPRGVFDIEPPPSTGLTLEQIVWAEHRVFDYFLFLMFIASLFLHTSSSRKVRHVSLPFVLLSFTITLFFLCGFVYLAGATAASLLFQ